MASATTIFACSSGTVRAGIAVWRLSGPDAGEALLALTGRTRLPEPRRATRVGFRTVDGDTFDDGLVLWFPAPASATGEDIAECHLHGSFAVGAKFTARCLSVGLRAAEPGEFTRRAVLNGKMDLIETEGLGQLLEAETDLQLRQARDAMAGVPAQIVAGWRADLLSALGVLEAAIDFPDEEDIPADIAQRALPLIEKLRGDLADARTAAVGARRLGEGLTLAIVGPPNAGKSTLLNWLAEEDRAIVSDIPGTTRDTVAVRLVMAGRLVNVLDTAGLRETTDDPIEGEGIARSRRAAAEADIVLNVRPAGSDRIPIETGGMTLDVVTKIDLVTEGEAIEGISPLTGQGMERFAADLERLVQNEAAPAPFGHVRQIARLDEALTELERAAGAARLAPELVAVHLQAAVLALDTLVGRVRPDDVLDEVFSAFCIGK